MELISANSNYLINLVPQSSVCDCSLTEINPDTSYVTMIPFYFPLLKMLCENECIPLFSIQTNGNLVILQVKTTSPKKYCVRPNIGIIKPKATVEFRGICIPLFYVSYIVFKSPQLCLYLGMVYCFYVSSGSIVRNKVQISTGNLTLLIVVALYFSVLLLLLLLLL